MCNRDNACDVFACPDEPTNQDKNGTVLRTYINDWKIADTSFKAPSALSRRHHKEGKD